MALSLYIYICIYIHIIWYSLLGMYCIVNIIYIYIHIRVLMIYPLFVNLCILIQAEESPKVLVRLISKTARSPTPKKTKETSFRAGESCLWTNCLRPKDSRTSFSTNLDLFGGRCFLSSDFARCPCHGALCLFDKGMGRTTVNRFSTLFCTDDCMQKQQK